MFRVLCSVFCVLCSVFRVLCSVFRVLSFIFNLQSAQIPEILSESLGCVGFGSQNP